ncbi:MAG: PocR ligand-binding domain-containing protein [Nitrospinae bacterium]|nr:PocR ligand-binding domain-containing protein [Nitrospinota bacterium]
MDSEKKPPAKIPAPMVQTPQGPRPNDPLSTDWNIALSPQTADLGELIDFSQLSEVLQSWQEVIGISAALIDLKGRVLASSRWQRVCIEFHRENPETLRRCLESDIHLAQVMQEGKQFAIYRCRNGLTDCATPIVIEGWHIANLFTGQFFLASPDMEFFRRQREEFGFPADEYEKALAEVPVMAEERLPGILKLLSGIASIIVSQTLARKKALAAKAEVERQVEERTAELAAVNKELEAFAYSVSHDLRAPLRSITGFAQLIQSRHGAHLPPEAREFFQLIVGNSERMNQLITGMLDFSRMRRSAMEYVTVDMEHLAKEVFIELAHAREGRSVSFRCGALPAVRGDLMMLHQVMMNLLSNAIKFTKTRENAVIAVEGEAGEGVVTYHVRDNGVGFNMRYAEKLFKVFQRLHAQEDYEGTGVGLALVHRIIERHGGRIWAESEEGVGTVFHFSLPAAR